MSLKQKLPCGFILVQCCSLPIPVGGRPTSPRTHRTMMWLAYRMGKGASIENYTPSVISYISNSPCQLWERNLASQLRWSPGCCWPIPEVTSRHPIPRLAQTFTVLWKPWTYPSPIVYSRESHPDALREQEPLFVKLVQFPLSTSKSIYRLPSWAIFQETWGPRPMPQTT